MIVEDKLPITKRLKKKRRQISMEHPSYVEKRGYLWRKTRNLEEKQGARGLPAIVLLAASTSVICFVALFCHDCHYICMPTVP